MNDVNFGRNFRENTAVFRQPTRSEPESAFTMADNHPTFQTASLEAWHKAATKSAPGGDLNALNWITPEIVADRMIRRLQS